MRRALGLLVAALALVALAGCSDTANKISALQGWVEADTVFVSPDEQGRVEYLRVRQGDHVDKGDLLFGLDDDLQRADLVVKEADVATAQQTFDRATELLKSHAGTQKALDDAWAALRRARANLEWSKTRLARRRVVSPAAGTIQEVYFRPGETVPMGKPVIALLPPANIKIRFYAPETELARITIGEIVAVSCDACAAGLTAKVSFIAGSAEYTPPVIYSREERAKLVYLIEARPEKPEDFRVGQPVSVMLPGATK